MKILFLGGNLSKSLANWLRKRKENVIFKEEKISMEEVRKICPDFILSYNYKFIIEKEIIDYVHGKAINLHISLLPYNRGAYPNVWSFIEDTPKGITIIYMDENIDTGDIIVQKEICIDEENETLESSYEILHREIQTLFKENWGKIKKSEITPYPQKGCGSSHYKKEYSKFAALIKEKSWDTPIKEFKEQWGKGLNKG